MKEMDSLTTEYAFNEHVNRSREPSPLRSQHARNSPVMMAEKPERPESYRIPTPMQNIGCQELLEMKCTHCGWLRKKRTTLKKLFSCAWPQAYVVLHDGCLYYFKNERAKTANGKFSLYGYNAIYRASEVPVKEAPWSMKIVHSHTEFKTYYFCASSEQEMKIWMGNIKKEMLCANGRSAIFGKNLQYQQADEKLLKSNVDTEKMDDPGFYQQIEENIYDDSSKFILSNDYQKKCSIKKENEDSDDEDLPDMSKLNERPPLTLPLHDPFITIIPPDRLHPFEEASRIPDISDTTTPPPPPRPSRHGDTGASPASSPVGPTPTSATPTSALSAPFRGPVKPPRQSPGETPATPPRTPRGRPPLHSPPSLPTTQTPTQTDTSTTDTGQVSRIQLLQKQLFETTRQPSKPTHPRINRRGSYEKTEGPGSKSPVTERLFTPESEARAQKNVNNGGGGSTGDEDPPSDTDEDWYFDEDKQKASDIIQQIGDDGVFLVRPENAGHGKVLVVYAFDTCKKYRIKREDNEYFLAKEGYHDTSLENLLRYYMYNNLPTVNMKLKTPFKQHPLFKSLRIT